MRTARLARAAGLFKLGQARGHSGGWDPSSESIATVEAAKTLVEEGFVVLPYTTDDHTVAQRLIDIGCATVMPYGSAIGTGQGLPNPERLLRIIEVARGKVTVVIDAGIGAPSDAALAMELGADAVLVNTAIAKAQNPIEMARAMALGVQAGRAAYLTGRIPKSETASPSSPVVGMVGK